jgi:acetyl-CoA acetyltransferase
MNDLLGEQIDFMYDQTMCIGGGQGIAAIFERL